MIRLICELYKIIEELENSIRNDKYTEQLQCIDKLKKMLSWGGDDLHV